VILIITKVRERLAESNKEAKKFEGERFNLRKINEQLDVRKKYHIETSNRFAASETISDVYTNRAWENIKENIENLSLRKFRSARIGAPQTTIR
jgi:hypothetical protein